MRSSLANHTGTWRTERPVYVDGLPPCNHACPAGEQVQAWLYTAEDGRLRAGLAAARRRQPVPGHHGPGLLPPVRDGVQPRRARHRRRHQLGRAVPRRRGDPAGLAAARARRPRPAGGCSSSAPDRPACRPRTSCGMLGHEVEIREAGEAPGGMMRFGIPTFRLPRDVLDLEIARLLATGHHAAARQPGDDLEATMREGRFDAAFLAIGAQLSHRAYIPAGQAARVSTRWRCSATRRGVSARTSAAGSSSTAAATPRWTPRAPLDGSARRSDRRLPPHPGADAGQRDRAARGARRGRHGQVAAHDHRGRRGHACAWRRWGSTTARRAPADRRVRGAGR